MLHSQMIPQRHCLPIWRLGCHNRSQGFLSSDPVYLFNSSETKPAFGVVEITSCFRCTGGSARTVCKKSWVRFLIEQQLIASYKTHLLNLNVNLDKIDRHKPPPKLLLWAMARAFIGHLIGTRFCIVDWTISIMIQLMSRSPGEFLMAKCLLSTLRRKTKPS